MFVCVCGGGGTLTLPAIRTIFLGVQTFEFRNVFSVEVFSQLFYWYVCQFEQVFLWVCQFSQEFWGCQFKNVCFYGVSLIQVTIIFGFIEILGEAVIRIRIIIIRINQIIEGSNHYSSSGSLLNRQLLRLNYTSFAVA